MAEDAQLGLSGFSAGDVGTADRRPAGPCSGSARPSAKRAGQHVKARHSGISDWGLQIDGSGDAVSDS